MRALAISLAVLLLACTNNDIVATIVVTPDGGRGAVATCNLCWTGRNACIIAISKACPRGYTITHESLVIEMVAECH